LSTNWHCAYQRWHSHLNECCHCQPNVTRFISLILRNSRIYYLRCNSSQEKELLQLTPHWLISPFGNWDIWLLIQTCQFVVTWLCQCYLELEGDRGPSSLVTFLCKFFYHITKDANIFHLKLGDSHRFSYFLTFTPSWHTSHHHGRSIASYQFLTYKYTTGGRLWTWRAFHSYFEPTWCPITSPFSFILLVCTFPSSMVCFLIKHYRFFMIKRGPLGLHPVSPHWQSRIYIPTCVWHPFLARLIAPLWSWLPTRRYWSFCSFYQDGTVASRPFPPQRRSWDMKVKFEQN
jgi:hypothetical protein